MKVRNREKMILIYNDGTIAQSDRVPSMTDKGFKDIDQILIPIIGSTKIHSFIPVPVTKLTTSSRVKITCQMQISYFDADDDDADGNESEQLACPLGINIIDSSDKIEIYNFLFSFLRYEMLNALEEVYVNSEIPSYTHIEPDIFMMELYGADPNPIYKINIRRSDSSTLKSSKIFKLIDKFFKFDKHPILSKFGKENVYRIRGGILSTVPLSSVRNVDLLGIGSPYTKTVSFIESREFILLKSGFKNASITIVHIDTNQPGYVDESDAAEYRDSLCPDMIPLKMFEYWINDVYTLMGFIDHLIFYAQLLDISIDLLYRQLRSDEYGSMNIETVILIEVEFYSIKFRRVEYKFKLDELPSMMEFVDMLNSYAPRL